MTLTRGNVVHPLNNFLLVDFAPRNHRVVRAKFWPRRSTVPRFIRACCFSRNFRAIFRERWSSFASTPGNHEEILLHPTVQRNRILDGRHLSALSAQMTLLNHRSATPWTPGIGLPWQRSDKREKASRERANETIINIPLAGRSPSFSAFHRGHRPAFR